MCQTNWFFVRHGKTLQAECNEERHLSSEGEAMARKMRERLFTYPFDFSFVSPAIRTRQTHDLIRVNPQLQPYVIPELLPTGTTDGDAINEMYAELGHVPLTEYLAHNRSGHLVRAAAQAMDRISGTLVANTPEESRHRGNYLIVGHAVILNAVVLNLVGQVGTQVQNELVATTVLGECEGFHLAFSLDESPRFSVHFLK